MIIYSKSNTLKNKGEANCSETSGRIFGKIVDIKSESARRGGRGGRSQVKGRRKGSVGEAVGAPACR